MQFKIKMLRNVVLVGYGREHMFHKGRTYRAEHATNQPHWLAQEKVFAHKTVRISWGEAKGFSFDHSMLLEKGDYVKV